MKIYEFSIVASGLDPAAEGFESRFYDAGCDDALVAFQKGHTIIDFAREAPSLADALASAVEDVVKTGATIDRIEPDPLVSLADMATRTGMSRAAMTQYSKGQRGRAFPAPSVKVTSESPLWDWAEVAWWFVGADKIDKETAVEAELVKAANKAIERGEKSLNRSLELRARELSAA